MGGRLFWIYLNRNTNENKDQLYCAVHCKNNKHLEIQKKNVFVLRNLKHQMDAPHIVSEA